MSKIVKLQLFKGRITYDENRNVATPNDVVKVEHGTKEFDNLLSNAGAFGYTSAKVLSVIDTENEALTNAYKQRDKLKANSNSSEKDIQSWNDKIQELREKEYKELKTESFQKEVDTYFAKEDVKSMGDQSETLTVLQKQNAELLKRLEALEKGGGSGNDDSNNSSEDNNENDSNDEDSSLEALQEKFEKLYGKKPHHKLGEEKLKEAIAKKENK